MQTAENGTPRGQTIIDGSHGCQDIVLSPEISTFQTDAAPQTKRDG